MTPAKDPRAVMVELTRQALPVDADGVCPGCGGGGFSRDDVAHPGRRVACRVRICRTCDLVLRFGKLPNFEKPTPRVVNALGGNSMRTTPGARLFTGNSIAYGRPIVEETTDGFCPACRHAVPRELKGSFLCPCGARVQLMGRTAAEVLRDRLKAAGGEAR